MTGRPHVQPLLTGRWDAIQTWEFFADTVLPDTARCTAVYCLAILPGTQQVVLTRNRRGWEMLGGHIESGETLEQALLRECLEEGGYVPERYQLFGYRKITATAPVSHSQQEGFYPFPHGYIPHYVAVSNLPLQPPSGEEIVESRTFSFADVASLDIEQKPLIKVGLAAYKSLKGI